MNHPYTVKILSNSGELEQDYLVYVETVHFDGEKLVADLLNGKQRYDTEVPGYHRTKTLRTRWNKHANLDAGKFHSLPQEVISILQKEGIPIEQDSKLPKGCPDLIFWNNEDFMFYECKRQGDHLRPEQQKFFDNFSDHTKLALIESE